MLDPTLKGKMKERCERVRVMLELKENIYWVGIKDWELKKFHGDEYSTHRGSTYNSYLIKDQKTALVDKIGRASCRERV